MLVIDLWNRYISGEFLTTRKDVLEMANTASRSKTRNLPSAYQQILANMEVLEDRILPIIEKLEQTIFNPDWEDPNKPKIPSDIVMDIDTNTMKVIGISVVVQYKDEELKPSDYIRDITYELKNAEKIGLSGKDGITLDYVTLMTVRMNSAKEVGYPTWQCAIGDQAMMPYFRKAINDHEWGEWVKVIDLPKLLEKYPEIIKMLSYRQIVDSLDQPGPDVQEPGDYWLETIIPDTGYYFLDLTTLEVTKVNDEARSEMVLADADTGVAAPGMETDFVFTLPGKEPVVLPPEDPKDPDPDPPVDPNPEDPDPDTPTGGDSTDPENPSGTVPDTPGTTDTETKGDTTGEEGG